MRKYKAGEKIMRIDLSVIHAEAPESGSADKTRPRAATADGGDSAKDTTRFSADPTTVQALAARVTELPEIRLAKIAALQQAIRGGNYAASAEHTASAIISEIERRPAA
jgi:flagellar biosynthesis anti-sigma factor FlgM